MSSSASSSTSTKSISNLEESISTSFWTNAAGALLAGAGDFDSFSNFYGCGVFLTSASTFGFEISLIGYDSLIYSVDFFSKLTSFLGRVVLVAWTSSFFWTSFTSTFSAFFSMIGADSSYFTYLFNDSFNGLAKELVSTTFLISNLTGFSTLDSVLTFCSVDACWAWVWPVLAADEASTYTADWIGEDAWAEAGACSLA